MGISNWKWPLALIHPELKGLDPFDPNLTLDQRILFATEFKINPWAYFRLCARVPGSTLDSPIYFRANRSNMALYWLYFNHITVCMLQPRQTGKTFGINALDSYLLNIGSQGARILLLTKDEKLRATTLTEIKTIEDLLPGYLKQHAKLDIGNREEINVSSLDNNYKALVARNDPIAADKTGRGHKVENTRVDEAAYLFFVQIALSAMFPATTAARELAEMTGRPYGNILATTAGKKDDRDGAYMYNYFHNGAPWSEFYMDSNNKEELRNAVKNASKDGKVIRMHCVFSHRQLGYTDEWLREVAAENNSYGEAFERDYLNIWTSGGQNSPFSIEDAKKIRASEIEVKFMEISKYGQVVTRWFLPEDEINRILASEHTAIAVDTSDGMGKDDIAFNIRHLKTGEVLGTGSINEINLITVSNFFIDVLKCNPKMTMIIERRNQAASIVDYMHKQMISMKMDPFKRMFNTCVQDHVEFPERFIEVQKPQNAFNENFLAQYKKFFGFVTSGSGATSRSELYGTTMRQAVRYTGDLIRDKQTIDQLLSLIIKNGRVDHPSGGHDDLCVAWLLSYWFMTSGRNLQYYGIPNGYVLSNNQTLNSTANKEEMYKLEQTRRAKAHIEMLLNNIKIERDHNVVERLVMEIENVKNFLGPQHEVSLSVDQMLTELKKNKLSRYHAKRPIYG